jgi:hypothetical protein
MVDFANLLLYFAYPMACLLGDHEQTTVGNALYLG